MEVNQAVFSVKQLADYLGKSKKWIYNHAIKEDGTFKYAGLLLFIDLTDCNYLADKYGNLIADNVIIYISKYLNLM